MSRTGGDGARRTFALLALVAVLAPAIALVISETRGGRGLEAQLYDSFLTIRGALPAPPEIVVVQIDEDSEEALGEWPWSREWHAPFLRNLERAGARVVAFDVTFGVARPEEDRAFRDALDETGIGILGARSYSGPVEGLEEPPGELGGAPIGIVHTLPDPSDGVIREYPILWRYPGEGGERLVPQLGVQAILEYLALEPDELEVTEGGWRLGEIQIPRGPHGGMRINYQGPSGTIEYRSYVDVIDDAETSVGWDMDEFEFLLEEGVFDDRIVLVGSTIPEHQDFHTTPFRGYEGAAEETPGVEIHAQAIATILSENFIRPVGFWTRVGWIFLLGLVVVASSPKLRGLWGAAVSLALAAGVVYLSYTLLGNHGIWLGAVGPLFSIGLSYSGATATLFLLEEQEKARIRGMFQQYVSSSVVDELIENPALLQLGGEERVLSVLFSDVVGFSTVSENLSPTELVELLNEYLTAMTEIILEKGGIIDKYQGDAIMAEFGAPIPIENHALQACLSALEMDRELVRLREKWRGEGKPLLEARIGINTGQMLLGNLGSRRIMDYTVMGDQVNLGARLEGTNKLYGTTIMVSETTWDEVKDRLVGRELDRIRVKGKEEPVRIFEIVGRGDEELPDGTKERLAAFDEALALYKERRFGDALAAFQEMAERHPEDGPARLYVGRCREYLADPPPDDWDGVYTMTTK